MSEDSKPLYHFTVLEDEGEASGCSSLPRGPPGHSSVGQRHRMGGYSQGRPDMGFQSEGSDSSGQDPPASPHKHRKTGRSRSFTEEEAEMKSSGSSGSGTESHGNDSNGHESAGSSNGNSKDSALLESSESNKRSAMALAGDGDPWCMSTAERACSFIHSSMTSLATLGQAGGGTDYNPDSRRA